MILEDMKTAREDVLDEWLSVIDDVTHRNLTTRVCEGANQRTNITDSGATHGLRCSSFC